MLLRGENIHIYIHNKHQNKDELLLGSKQLFSQKQGVCIRPCRVPSPFLPVALLMQQRRSSKRHRVPEAAPRTPKRRMQLIHRAACICKIEIRAAVQKIEKAMQRKAKSKPMEAKPETDDEPATKKRRVDDEYEDDAALPEAPVPARKESGGKSSRLKVNARFKRNIRNMWSLVISMSSHDAKLDIRR